MAYTLRTACRVICAFALLAVAGWSSQAAAFSGKRVALVVGNGTYPTAPLKNPVNDARAVAKALKDLGFEVTLRENAGQRDMAAAVRQFGASIAPGSAAVFYYAGHGMQVKGRNYLVPTDADIQLEDEVPYSAIDVNQVLDKMEVGKSAINIVILDACRNNPFARRFRSSGTGLAQMDAPIGTLIAFATAPGSVAQDGTGENGVYTKHLLESIAVPGLPVEQMFKRVRIGVAKDTNEAQVPWESSSMKGDFAFREAPPPQAVPQEKLIEEAARAAAERAAAMTAARMARDEAERQKQFDLVKAEQAALAAEREKLLRERERLEAENEALRRQPARVAETVALAAPTPAVQAPAAALTAAAAAVRRNWPQAGDRWTYRYSDGYGKTATYSVRVTAASEAGITDEISIGKARQSNAFEPGIEWVSRNLAGLPLREISPYLQSLGPAEPTAEWNNVGVPGGSGTFTARAHGTEKVTVPAGSFEALKIVISGAEFVRGTSTRRLKATVWYAPEARRFVRMSFESPQAAGLQGDRDIIELVDTSFKIETATASAAAAPAPHEAVVARLSQTGIGESGAGLPKAGDTWTYRFSDMYGRSETYSVRVTSASPGVVVDEGQIGRARQSASFEPGLAPFERKLGNLMLREISPYLLSLGPLEETAEWKRIPVFDGSDPFTARLAGQETVKVPAGTFEARKVVIEGREVSRKNSQFSRPYTITAWFAPAARRVVKMTYAGTASGPIPAEQETIELTGFRLQ